jgi:hypothetical protein
MDAAEEHLSSTLDAVVGGMWLHASPAQVTEHLSHFFQVAENAVQVHRYRNDSFLLVFADRRDADRVLHASTVEGADLLLVFRKWHCQAGASFLLPTWCMFGRCKLHRRW